MCQSIWWPGQGLLHEQVSVTFDKNFDAIWNWTNVYTWTKSIFIYLYNIFFYPLIMMWNPCTGHYFVITANSL